MCFDIFLEWVKLFEIAKHKSISVPFISANAYAAPDDSMKIFEKQKIEKQN